MIQNAAGAALQLKYCFELGFVLGGDMALRFRISDLAHLLLLVVSLGAVS